MSTLLIAIAAVLVVVSAFGVAPSSSDRERVPTSALLTLGILFVGLLVGAFLWQGAGEDPWRAAVGFGLGAAGAAVALWARPKAEAALALSTAALVSAACLLLPSMATQLGALMGAAFGSWVLLKGTPALRAVGAIYAAALAAAIAVDALGAKAFDAAGYVHSGSMLITIGAVAALSSLLVGAKGKTSLGAIVALGLLLLGAFLIGGRYLQSNEVWLMFVGGAALALVIHWMLLDEGSDTLRPLVAAVIWISLGTLAFAVLRGYGMSLALLGAVSALLIFGSGRTLLTLGPLFGLVLYRLFREAHVDATRALDIGQHYALIGLTLGAILPLVPVDWRRAREEAMPLPSLLWAALMVGAPIVVAVVMGPKGVVGFVAGLGFAALLERIRGGFNLHTLTLGLGTAAAATLVYGWLGETAQLTREQKVSALWPLAIGVGLVVIVLWLLTPKPQVAEAEAR